MKVSKDFQLSLIVIVIYFTSTLLGKVHDESTTLDDQHEDNLPTKEIISREKYLVEDNENFDDKFSVNDDGYESDGPTAEDENPSKEYGKDSTVPYEQSKRAIVRVVNRRRIIRTTRRLTRRSPLCPILRFPCSRMPQVCANMRNAIRLGKPRQLNRIVSPSQIRRNRRESCGNVPGRTGFSCDEYPFASSSQGGRGAVVRLVPARENSIQGGVLRAFYSRNRIGNGGCYFVMV